MGNQGHISFEDWVGWVFDRKDGQWVWGEEVDNASWLSNSQLAAEHFVYLHNNSVESLSEFSNAQVGWGLWNIYSHIVEISPIGGFGISPGLHHAMIRSLLPMMRQLLPERVSHHEGFRCNEISDAIFMFWDMSGIWPFCKADGDLKTQEVCFEEMEAALLIKHPVAHDHALHGLGEFHSESPERVAMIIDQWLEKKPHVLPYVLAYASQARIGAVI